MGVLETGLLERPVGEVGGHPLGALVDQVAHADRFALGPFAVPPHRRA